MMEFIWNQANWQAQCSSVLWWPAQYLSIEQAEGRSLAGLAACTKSLSDRSRPAG